jgi:hypothetical protein
MLSPIRLRGQFPAGDRLHRYPQQLLGHMLLLDGVYLDGAGSAARFRWAKAPTSNDRLQNEPAVRRFSGNGNGWPVIAHWANPNAQNIPNGE